MAPCCLPYLGHPGAAAVDLPCRSHVVHAVRVGVAQRVGDALECANHLVGSIGGGLGQALPPYLSARAKASMRGTVSTPCGGRRRERGSGRKRHGKRRNSDKVFDRSTRLPCRRQDGQLGAASGTEGQPNKNLTGETPGQWRWLDADKVRSGPFPLLAPLSGPPPHTWAAPSSCWWRKFRSSDPHRVKNEERC